MKSVEMRPYDEQMDQQLREIGRTMKTTQEAEREIRRERGKLAERTRRRIPGDPALEQSRANLLAAQAMAAQLGALDGVELRNANASPAKWIRALDVKGVPLGVVLLETVELLAYLVRLSDRPDEMLAALRERVSTVGID